VKVKLHPVQYDISQLAHRAYVSAQHKEFTYDWTHEPALMDFVDELLPKHQEKFLFFMEQLAKGIDAVQNGIREAVKEKKQNVGG
jgi:hypothetical protein